MLFTSFLLILSSPAISPSSNRHYLSQLDALIGYLACFNISHWHLQTFPAPGLLKPIEWCAIASCERGPCVASVVCSQPRQSDALSQRIDSLSDSSPAHCSL